MHYNQVLGDERVNLGMHLNTLHREQCYWAFALLGAGRGGGGAGVMSSLCGGRRNGGIR